MVGFKCDSCKNKKICKYYDNYKGLDNNTSIMLGSIHINTNTIMITCVNHEYVKDRQRE